MYYDAVAHTQKAVKNLQSEVRFMLKKPAEEILPSLNHRFSLSSNLKSSSDDKSISLRHSQTRTYSGNEKEETLLNSMQTINFCSQSSERVLNKIKLKGSPITNRKVILPNLEKKGELKNSLKSIENALIEQANLISGASEELSYFFTDSPKRKCAHLLKINRKISKGSSLPKSSNLQTISNIEETNYSPWQAKDETDIVSWY